MPALSVYAIRAALLHLAIGLTMGLLLLANKGVPFAPETWRLLPAHMEHLLMGWTAQLGLAVAHWIIPRFRGGDFGRLRLAYIAFLLLNAGVLLVSLTPILSLPAYTTLAGRLLETSAAAAYAVYLWPRIRPLGH
jgi:hypothetical protein